MINIGIIGLGAIGQRLINGFLQHPSITIVAICDQNAERLLSTKQQLENVQAFQSHKEMLESLDLDLVYVAVPPKYHHAIALDVISKGIHILCEKPLANSIEEARDLYERAHEKGIIHAMNFPLNYSAGSNTFAQLIQDGFVGDVRRVEVKLRFPQWPRPWQQNEWIASREQGGFVLEVGVHYIQQIQRIFGNINVMDVDTQYPDDPTASERGILAHLQLEDGTPLIVDGLSHIAGEEEIRFTAYGTEGTLSLLNWADLEGGKIGSPITMIEPNEELTSSLADHLVAAIEGKEATLIDFKAGYDAQIVLEKLRA
ncbi:Gfo/Idh/MocA family protein [Priestia koreensis]|uniref:Gfo/Idh/MocA family protein n=1 Tax=Priestia koreensis TaxID=284581 RepID=UPI00203BF4E4|nr:Gfo/Idh/MocA family oxidoreductase [Priestia koreensis]MCM3006491.1 Gfo/Idh/MocA family oxidoreductase [Priestia koreensis]